VGDALVLVPLDVLQLGVDCVHSLLQFSDVGADP